MTAREQHMASIILYHAKHGTCTCDETQVADMTPYGWTKEKPKEPKTETQKDKAKA